MMMVTRTSPDPSPLSSPALWPPALPLASYRLPRSCAPILQLTPTHTLSHFSISTRHPHRSTPAPPAQILAGLVEERGIEVFFRSNPAACAALSFIVRTGNTFLGS